VEILADSEGSRRRDPAVKLELYEQTGIPHYRIVDPRAKPRIEHEIRGDRHEKIASHGSGDPFRPPPSRASRSPRG